MSKKYLQITLFSGLLRAIALAMTACFFVIASGAKQSRYWNYL